MKNILILLALTGGLYAQDGAVREAMNKKMEQEKVIAGRSISEILKRFEKKNKRSKIV